MSTDPTPIPPDPEAVPPPETPTAESTGAAADQGAGEEAKTPRIKIGTQRPGVAVPRVEPRAKVAFRTPGVEATGGRRHQAATESRSENCNVRRSPSRIPSSPSRRNPNSRFPPRRGPKWNRRICAGLSPELEAELKEALGDQSMEELISAVGTAGAVAASQILEPETRLQARVARIFRDDVFVDLGGRNQGVLPLHSFAKEPEVGAMLDVIVTKFNSDEGLYELTAPGMSVDVGDWSDITEGIVVEAHVTGHNKGGLECEVNKLRGFIPAGQVSIYRVENLEEFVGQRWPCVVIEANPQRKNLVLSRRAMLEREQAAAKEQLLSQLEVGQTREGTCAHDPRFRRVCRFGRHRRVDSREPDELGAREASQRSADGGAKSESEDSEDRSADA